MKKYFLVLVICISIQYAMAQTIIQDNKGQTVLDLKPAKTDGADEAKVDTIECGGSLIKLSTIGKNIELNDYHYRTSHQMMGNDQDLQGDFSPI